jgi:hypothetical protein
MLLDLLDRRRRRRQFFLANCCWQIPVRATMELGRSGRAMMMTSASPGRGCGDGGGAGPSAAG